MENAFEHKPVVLVVEDEVFSQKFLKEILVGLDYCYVGVTTLEEGRAYLQNDAVPDLILLDIRLPDGSGLDLFKWIREQDLMPPVILMTAYGTISDAVCAMKAGAYDFITKPFAEPDIIRADLIKALEHGRLRNENVMLRTKLASVTVFQKIIGQSKLMGDVFFLIQRASQTRSNVLIEGKTGTGKELVAKAIHVLSDRKDQAFVAVNCGALPENILEAALFGHEKGAFTGADKQNNGFFEEADKGTLFLDEIGDAPLSVQIKILRVVEYGTIYRVGSTKPLSVDVRFLFATHKDLRSEIEKGHFREDLFYRINVIKILLPSLDERREDIPLLIKYFIDQICLELGVGKKEFNHDAISYLFNRSWPGNVRELKNYVERTIALHRGKDVSREDLAALDSRNLSKEAESLYDFDFNQAKSNFEKKYFKKLIDRCNGDFNKAVEMSGVHRATIYRKVKDLNVK